MLTDRSIGRRSPLGIISNLFSRGNVVKRRCEGPSPSGSPPRRTGSSHFLVSGGSGAAPSWFHRLLLTGGGLGHGGGVAPLRRPWASARRNARVSDFSGIFYQWPDIVARYAHASGYPGIFR